MKYRTIVADPPWPYEQGCVALGPGHGTLYARQPLPYDRMSVADFNALSIQDLAERDYRLFCWTTNRYLASGLAVVDAWGFRYRQTLVWRKTGARPWEVRIPRILSRCGTGVAMWDRKTR